ncbi:Hypothetical protein, putative, partial [Bodo saltans]
TTKKLQLFIPPMSADRVISLLYFSCVFGTLNIVRADPETRDRTAPKFFRCEEEQESSVLFDNPSTPADMLPVVCISSGMTMGTDRPTARGLTTLIQPRRRLCNQPRRLLTGRKGTEVQNDVVGRLGNVRTSTSAVVVVVGPV